LTGVVDRRFKGDIEVDERKDDVAERDEKTLEGGFEMGVSRSDENSKPGKFPKWSERGGNDVAVELGYIPLMHDEISEMKGKTSILQEGAERTRI
jgi:hypothetical protein